MKQNRHIPILFSLPLLSLFWTGGAGAQEEDMGWKNVTELTLVMTGGNATARTLGFKSTIDYLWPRTALQISGGGVRTETGTVTRTASGTPSNFSVSETTDTRTTAENYFLKGRMDRSLTDAAFLFAGGGWDRNTFAGVDNRYGFVAGAGRTWFSEDSRKLKTDLGLTYTIQDDVVENPDIDDAFLGLRGSYDYSRQLSETTGFTSVLVADQNLNETDDLRADWTNSISVAMSDRLALKTSFQVLYDNSPALVAVPLGDDEVLTPLGEVDTLFTVAIVANF